MGISLGFIIIIISLDIAFVTAYIILKKTAKI
jgi:hypothetical protein